MKKLLAVVLLAALLLTACAQAPSGVYEADGLRLTVDWDQCKIDDGQYVYNYTREETGNGEKIVITYPNGVQYCVNGKNGTVLSLSANQTGDISDYISPETLYAAIDDQRPVTPKVFQGFDGYDILMLFLGICIILFGIFHIVSPESAWKFNFNWQAENATPNDRGISLTIFRGVLIILTSLFLIAYVILGAFR